ncbi:hypothetical protein HYH03_011313 [Edaphochlamys debaryana]|uniref:ABM domain-containing protein n=1 Tax=Edaphochlamys debaryana TaxID=47281 RepID=A0A835XUU7_9CHLO|nr:hypothetical protein HYH03_011313 [Edaphochlamys debaryana]|eukprot:KAG2490185.1 hypothetical protein HYH03_011313 [Edaphochlamys debaryana]
MQACTRAPTVSRPACATARPVLVRSAPAAHEATTQKSYHVVMNVFQVKPDSSQDFEDMWRSRESRLKQMPGFVRFAMLRCENKPGKYISQTYWADKESFENWTKSSQFQASHSSNNSSGQGGRPATMTMLEAPPSPEFYSAVTVTE